VKFRWLLLFAVFPLFAHALETGERLAPWTLLDQYEQPFTLDDSTTTLLVARIWTAPS